MKRQNIFTFRVSNQERQLIAELAKNLQRSQSDAVRFVVIEATKQLVIAGSAPATALRTEDLKQAKGVTNVTN